MEIIKIDDAIWRIEDGHVRFFLLTGTEKALLIDTGMTAPNAREIAEGLTDLPIELLNTHTDPDHTAGNDLRLDSQSPRWSSRMLFSFAMHDNPCNESVFTRKYCRISIDMRKCIQRKIPWRYNR